MSRTFFCVGSLIALFILAAFTSCGGGSTGTDGGFAKQLVGTVVTSEGTPAANVSITNLENGDTTTTDSNGNYSIATSGKTKEIRVIVAKEERETQLSIETPTTVSFQVIKADLVLDEGSFDVVVSSVSVVPQTTATPSPTVKPAPSGTSTPNPNATVTPSPSSPSVEPDPSSSPSPSRSPTPSATPTPTPSPTPEPFYDIVGTLKVSSGQPVEFMSVEVQGDRLISESNSRGEFNLSTNNHSPVLIVSNRNFSRSVSIGFVAPQTKELRIELVIIPKGIFPNAGRYDGDFSVVINTP